MTTIWYEMYITDHTGLKVFRTQASEMSAPGQLRELKRHLENIKNKAHGYGKVGANSDTCFIVYDGERLVELEDIDDDDLLAQLLD